MIFIIGVLILFYGLSILALLHMLLFIVLSVYTRIKYPELG
jgi:hypothetical protein